MPACPETYTMAIDLVTALEFKTWLMSNGYVNNDLPTTRAFFRDLCNNKWHRLKRPLPAPSATRTKRDGRLQIDLASWRHISKAIQRHFHNEPRLLVQDIIAGNWRKAPTETALSTP